MGTVTNKGWWPDSDSRYKEDWTMSVSLGLNEPKGLKNRWVSVSVPVKSEIATISISPIVWARICDGRTAMIKSTVYRDGKRLRLYWNFNCEAHHQLQITNHNGGIEFMENITAMSVRSI